MEISILEGGLLCMTDQDGDQITVDRSCREGCVAIGCSGTVIRMFNRAHIVVHLDEEGRRALVKALTEDLPS